MSPSQSGYLVGIGSNIEPYKNIKNIIALLLQYFPEITISRILSIPPVGMNSQHDFLNAVVFIKTDRTKDELKQVCNSIEIAQGRNRNDPDRKFKDRPADLDILTYITLPKDADKAVYTMTDEYFLYPLLDEVIAYLMAKPVDMEQSGIEFVLDNLAFGQSATTIYRNANTSNKRVIQ